MQKRALRSLGTRRPRTARPLAKQPSMFAIAERTRASWSKVVTCFDMLPEALKDPFKTLLGDAGQWPYTILLPTYEGFMQREAIRLISCLEDRIYIVEKGRQAITCTCFPIGEISYVEQGMILLHAWVKINGISADGVPSSCTLKFNSVTDYMFTPIIRAIRPAIGDVGDVDGSLERAKFDYLVRLNFKFMTYGKQSILPGEKVLHIVLQPEMRNTIFRAMGRSFYRIISTAHISILTDKELILVQDEEQSKWSRDARYGSTRRYIALNKIGCVSLAQEDQDLLALCIHLPGDDSLMALFSTSNEREVDVFFDRLAGLVAEVRRVGFSQ
jgi:hypothetical protein